MFNTFHRGSPEIYVQYARQYVEPIRAEDAGPPPPPQRGSAEETRRILNEINKINQAFGYTRKSDIALPRQGPANSNYFYPRPVYQPPVIQNSKRPPYNRDQVRYSRDLNPFKAEMYYYPSPYLRLPIFKRDKAFVSSIPSPYKIGLFEKQSYFKAPIYVKEAYLMNNHIRKLNKNGRFPKHMSSSQDSKKTKSNTNTEYRQEQEDSDEDFDQGLVETIVKVISRRPEKEEPEDAYDYSNEVSNEGEEEEETPDAPIPDPSQVPVTNDKFLNKDYLNKNNNEMRLPGQVETRSFNFSTPVFIKNLTDRFSKPQISTPNSMVSIVEEGQNIEVGPAPKEDDISEYDSDEDAYIEGLRAPWSGAFPAGPKNQKEMLQHGGLIIQRLRVKNGSIAVAGSTAYLF